MAGAQGIDSDDFSGSTFPETFWTKHNENGASISREGFGTSDARANLNLPSGSGYEMWGSWGGLVMTQPASDGDFSIECKIDVFPAVNSYGTGILAVDSGNTKCVACAFYWDSGTFHLLAANLLAPQSYDDETPGTPTAPLWFRLERVGTDWSFWWRDSSLQTSWSEFHADQTEDFTVAKVGFYQDNFGTSSATTVKYDWFWEITDPISPEDPTGGVRRVFVTG